VTQNEKRIKIAVLNGYKIEWQASGDLLITSPSNTVIERSSPNGRTREQTINDCAYCFPDYFGSLDAIHEAVQANWQHEKAYIRQLIDICQTPEDAILATAEQRCEAFGKALNLW